MVNERQIGMDMKNMLVDIFIGKNKMRVVAELPGANEEDVALDLYEDILSISALGGKLAYYKDVELPRICKGTIGKIFTNGILEITLN